MLMEVKDLEVGYGKRVVVDGVSMTIGEGEIVGLIGHNGAGKTTSLKGIFGLLKPYGGQIVYNGQVITGRRPLANVKDRITFIPQEHFIFPGLNVRENLDLGGYTVENKEDMQSRLEMIYDLFPILKQRERQTATTLSGGERRMLGLGMALITGPRLLLLDEPSLGLAPLLVQSVMDTLRQIQQTLGTSILLVEQNVKQALQLAQRVYVMKMGRIILEESGESLLQRGEWWSLF
ncbi:MAG: ABC transporter ATP-binding protein [Dehalococcoidia bacterium]|nr:ABC transporter ATP-binding protein [Dehalococcoidia bacterium]